MTTNLVPATDSAGFFRRALRVFRDETGHSLALWALIALLSFMTQIVLHRELMTGEFGTLNTLLGVIGLMTVPPLAVNRAFIGYFARTHAPDRLEQIAALRAAALLVTETFTWVWGGISILILFLVMPLVALTSPWLHLLTQLNVFIALGVVVSGAMCRSNNRFFFWSGLLLVAAVARLLFSGWLASRDTSAPSALAGFMIAGFITLIPLFGLAGTTKDARIKAFREALDPDFLLYLGATFSVLLAIFLFGSADRIIAQSWFGVVTSSNMGYVNWPMFDAYQAAGLLGRALLWGTQPLLLVLFVQRSRLDHTTAASLTWFWIYVVALLLGAILLGFLSQPLSRIFCGTDFSTTASFVSHFALAMIPLGLLQALGMFALASRRYHECFVLGGCGVGYTLLLYLVGRQPQLMPVYMFGGGLVILMIVLFVGVVRWGRKQP